MGSCFLPIRASARYRGVGGRRQGSLGCPAKGFSTARRWNANLLAEEQEKVGQFRVSDRGSRGDILRLKLGATRKKLAEPPDLVAAIGECPPRAPRSRFAPPGQGISAAFPYLADDVRQQRVSPAQGLVDPPSYSASPIAREREKGTRRGGDGKAIVDEQLDGRQDFSERSRLERNEVAR